MNVSLGFSLFLLLLMGGGVAHAAEAYRLGTGDRIKIEIHGEEVLTESTIGDSGSLTLPYIGDIQVAGLTQDELRTKVRAALVPDYFVDPDIIVTVESYRSFFVYGEVSKPGSYEFEPGLTVGKAIALAGGLTDRASRRKIFLVRDGMDSGSGTRVDETAAVRPGDVITIEQSFF